MLLVGWFCGCAASRAEKPLAFRQAHHSLAATPPEAKPLFCKWRTESHRLFRTGGGTVANPPRNLSAQTFLTSQVSSVYFWPSIKNRSFENSVEARPPKVISFALDEGLEVVERGRSPKLTVIPFVGSSELVAAAKSAGLSPYWWSATTLI